MADTKTAGAGAPSVWEKIQADLKKWLGEVEAGAATAVGKVWDATKALFQTVSADQAAIVQGLADEAIREAKAGDSWESIVTDILNRAEKKELGWITELPSEVILAIAALVKHANFPTIVTPSTVKK